MATRLCSLNRLTTKHQIVSGHKVCGGLPDFPYLLIAIITVREKNLRELEEAIELTLPDSICSCSCFKFDDTIKERFTCIRHKHFLICV